MGTSIEKMNSPNVSLQLRAVFSGWESVWAFLRTGSTSTNQINHLSPPGIRTQEGSVDIRTCRIQGWQMRFRTHLTLFWGMWIWKTCSLTIILRGQWRSCELPWCEEVPLTLASLGRGEQSPPWGSVSWNWQEGEEMSDCPLQASRAGRALLSLQCRLQSSPSVHLGLTTSHFKTLKNACLE